MIKENRISKYLLYAIGEIVLVVIGILIALQINNWNGERQNYALVESYTESLIKDLAKDSADITRKIEAIRSDSAALKGFEDRVSNANQGLDTLYKIARYEFEFLINGKFDYNSDTYEVLISTGDITLFEKDIIADLHSMFNLQELAKTTATHTFESYRTNVHSYAKKYPVPFQSNMIKNGSPAADLIWNQISLEAHATEFNALVLAKGDSYRLSLRYLPQLKLATNELLQKLRSQ